MPKVFQIDTTRQNALLTVAMVSALALTQWFLGSESVPAAAAQVPGTIIVAQNPPPKCGQDPQHPCPKAAAAASPQRPAAGSSRLRSNSSQGRSRRSPSRQPPPATPAQAAGAAQAGAHRSPA